MASFLEDLVGGGAQYGAEMLADQRKADIQEQKAKSLAELNAQLDVKKQTEIEKLKAEFAEQARVKRNDNVSAQLDKNATTAFPGVDELPATMADGTPMSAEARANYEQGKGIIAAAKQRYKDEPLSKVRAEVDAGYEGADKLATADAREKAAVSKSELSAAQLDFKYQNMQRLAEQAKDNNNIKLMLAAIRSAGGGSDGAGGDTAKLKQAQTYMDNVNKERKARGEEPITWEDAYNAANYSPKQSADEKFELKRADATKELMKQGYEGKELADKVDEYMKVAAPKKTTPAAKASASKPLPMPSQKSALVEGQIYQTPRGPATWSGGKFVQ